MADPISEQLAYYLNRSRIERAAAQSATCPEARSAHLQLAERYEQIVRRGEQQLTVPPEGSPAQPLIVLTNE